MECVHEFPWCKTSTKQGVVETADLFLTFSNGGRDMLEERLGLSGDSQEEAGMLIFSYGIN